MLRRVSYQSELPGELVISSSLLFVFSSMWVELGIPNPSTCHAVDVELQCMVCWWVAIPNFMLTQDALSPDAMLGHGRKGLPAESGCAKHSGCRRSRSVVEHGSRPPTHDLLTTVKNDEPSGHNQGVFLLTIHQSYMI